jgi:hypothetical protein
MVQVLIINVKIAKYKNYCLFSKLQLKFDWLFACFSTIQEVNY